MLTDKETHQFSPEAEKAVLAACFISKDVFETINKTLLANDFFDPRHTHIFADMKLLHSKGVELNVTSVSNEINSNRPENEHHMVVSYLDELSKDTPQPENAKTYASIVKQRSVLRKLIHLSTSMAAQALENPTKEQVTHMLDYAEKTAKSLLEQIEQAEQI